MLQQRKNISGFTIVELLIVIIVIAILAAITIVAYNGIQDRARATTVTSDLKTTKQAFKLLAIDEGRSTWWIDNELVGWANPKIKSIIGGTNFGKYMQRLSNPTTDDDWVYDNDGDTYNGCSATNTGGVNVYVYNIDSNIAQLVDKNIDDGNLACGSITYLDTTLRYNLSRTSAFN